MRTMPFALLISLLCGLAVSADDVPAKKDDSVPLKSKSKEYTEFSKLIQDYVIKQTPKQLEHRDGWGETIPLGNQRLPFPNLRTYLKDGDKVVLPHGAWKKLKIKIDDPAKDVKIHVKEFKPIDATTYRLVLDADIQMRADGEWQQWQKGLQLLNLGVETDVTLNIGVGCDVGVALNFKKTPPEIDVAPKVTDLSLDLVDIRGRNGPVIGDEALRNDVKGLLRGAVKFVEPQVKDVVNQAIVQSLKDGKGSLSAGALLKALPKEKL